MKGFLSLFLFLALGLALAKPGAAQTPTLSIADASIVEGNSRFRELFFPVTLSQAQTFDVSASFKTRDISATAGSDYTPQSAGQIVIRAGNTRAVILIRVLSDTVEEKDESFLVQLGAPKRCGISDSDGIGSVKDDDYGGQISIGDLSVVELDSGQRLARIEVKFSRASLHDVTVNYETKDEGAKTSTGDYIATRGSLLFKPGRLVLSVSVPVVGDVLVEDNERFLLRISVPGIAISKSLGYVTIQNDDTPSQTRGKIVFASSRDGNPDGNSEIYIMNADGSNQTRLTQNPGEDSFPALSPDGTKIAWTSARDGLFAGLYVMNADGSEPKLISGRNGRGYHAEFSPDGSKIVFTFIPDRSTSDIYVINPDGTNATRLTSNPRSESDPSFSPDGAKIVFVADYEEPDHLAEIFVMNADGTGVAQFTDTRIALNPTYSPYGDKIVFPAYDNENRYRLFVIDTDGFNYKQLVASERNGSLNADYPDFSPDGSALALMVYSPNDTQIYSMNDDGTNLTPLTSLGDNRHPSWSIGSVPPPAASQNAAPAPSAGDS